MHYYIGEQGGQAWTAPLARTLEWPGSPPRDHEAATVLVIPGPDLTWDHWASVLAGLWTLSIKHEGYDFDAQIEWRNAPAHSLGMVYFDTHRSP